MSTPNPTHIIADALDECELSESMPDDLAAHVVSKLTDAGYSIIQLPEGENNWEVTNWDGGRVSLCYGGDTVRCYLPNPALEVGEAERLGIALIAASHSLAAARAVGGES